MRGIYVIIFGGGETISTLHGNITGLKAGEIKRLENIYRRKVPTDTFITPELGRYMTLLSREISRQIGVVIDRRGNIVFVIVGDNRGLVIPDLSDYPIAHKRLRGLRLIHTHLKEEPLTNDDMTDLALLRLDTIAALGVQADGFPGRVSIAHLLPPNSRDQAWNVIPAMPFHQLDINPVEFTEALED
jgi:GTP-binding protein HflX